MNITLPPDLEEYVGRRSAEAGYGSANAVVCEALRRLMEEEEQHENAVVEAMKEEGTPLTSSDLSGVRDLIKKARGSRPV